MRQQLSNNLFVCLKSRLNSIGNISKHKARLQQKSLKVLRDLESR